jgi:hypothetical protein
LGETYEKGERKVVESEIKRKKEEKIKVTWNKRGK